MPALTRGPLSPSVYWRRRLVVLTVALLLLWGMLHLLSGGQSPKAAPAADLTGASTSSSASPTASSSTSASAEPSTSASASTAPTLPTTPTVSQTPTPTVLPTPTGACPPSDISVTPSVTGAAAGADVAIVLTLQTFSTPACTWHVSHKSMQVKVTTAGGTDVWSTVQCPAALPTSDVVVYKDTPTQVSLTWSARRADATCSTHTAWSKAGKYSVTGVALGGVPGQTDFTLGAAGTGAAASQTTAPPATTTPTTTTPATTTPGSTAPASSTPVNATPAGAPRTSTPAKP